MSSLSIDDIQRPSANPRITFYLHDALCLKFEGTTEAVIRRRRDKQWTKEKGPNNDLQSTTQNSKDRATRTPHRTRDERMCSGKISSFCPTSGTHRVTLVHHD
jgi:hypothetical protein